MVLALVLCLLVDGGGRFEGRIYQIKSEFSFWRACNSILPSYLNLRSKRTVSEPWYKFCNGY